MQKVKAIDKGFLPIELNDKFFEVEIKAFLIYGQKFLLEKKLKVVVDFSSSNIAKQMINYFRRIIIQNIRILRQEVVRNNLIGEL